MIQMYTNVTQKGLRGAKLNPNESQHFFQNPMTDPWDWYIYLHEWLTLMVNVGKYVFSTTGFLEEEDLTFETPQRK